MGIKNGLYLIFFPQYRHSEDWENDYDDDGTCIKYSRGLGVALYIGDIPQQFFFLYYENLREKFRETYGEMTDSEDFTERPARMELYLHESDESVPNGGNPPLQATEMELMHMLRNYKKVSPGQREMFDIAIDIKKDIMQFITGSDKQSPAITDTADYPRIAQATQKPADTPTDGDITAKALIASFRKRGKKTNLNTIIKELFERLPETRTLSSDGLLLYLQSIAKRVGREIKVSASRIRQLDAWKENEVHRKSGKSQNWENMNNAADENAIDVNSVNYEND